MSLLTKTVAEATCSVGSGELFDGYFDTGRQWNFQKDQLIDARACEAGVYPFQLPLHTRSGPWVKAEGRELLMLSSYDYLGLIASCAFAAGMLREMGLGVTPIMFPAVPLGSARLRLCVTAAHRIEDLEFALDCFRRLRG